ncbi:MAG TPA: transcriptional regulator [Clostridiales bacterium]|nr:transcriptional regulator [Clostridiales bacterium]
MKETFGQRFQRLRKAANFTQEDVAKRLNISAQAVSKWENDISAPDISALTDIADMFGVTTDVLLGKSADEATFVPDAKKDIDNLMFRVFVDSADGDKVRVNLPVALVKIFAESDDGGDVKINGKNILQGIDLKQLLSLVERGLLGKIVEVTSADGDKIEVVVE